jgi:hypothetical protein
MKKNFVLSAVIIFAISLFPSSMAQGAEPMPFTAATGIATEGPAIQAQIAEMEAARLGQIKSALLGDFWRQYRLYIQALAAGESTTDAIYPRWPLSATPTDPKANFKYLADKYLPDLQDQLRSMSRTTGVPETDFYEIEYVPPATGEPLPAPGHVVIRRLHAETATQGRIRGLLGSVTVENIGSEGVISMRVDPPSAFMGSDALNVSLVRNNGLTLDPILAQELSSSETGGPDITFLPGTWVTFAKKGTNPGTAQAKGEAEGTVYSPTLRFKGKDGHITGVNEIEMDQAFGDPAARLMFKRAAAATGGVLDANYIRFEDNLGSILGLASIYRRDGPDGRSGDDMDLAIWAHVALGGDFTMLRAGDTVNGETAGYTGVIRFGLGNTARVFLSDSGELKIESNNTARIKAPTVTVDGNLEVTENLEVAGTSNMTGSVTMHNNLNMSNTDINNVKILRAGTAILNALTLNGKTGSKTSPYDIWAANAAHATFADDSALLNGHAEHALRVAFADVAGALNEEGIDLIKDKILPIVDSKISDIPIPKITEGKTYAQRFYFKNFVLRAGANWQYVFDFGDYTVDFGEGNVSIPGNTVFTVDVAMSIEPVTGQTLSGKLEGQASFVGSPSNGAVEVLNPVPFPGSGYYFGLVGTTEPYLNLDEGSEYPMGGFGVKLRNTGADTFVSYLSVIIKFVVPPQVSYD